MKNQYFGDINDYRKYGILRALQAGSGLPLGVCWMLTPDDGGADGRKVGYLHDPDRWRHFDPEVFDHLRAALLEERRSIRVAEETFLGTARSYPNLIGHREEDRSQFFADLLTRLNEPGLVFFDPDNGMEVESKPLGRRGAEKYLFWNELEGVFNAGHSCFVYQHFRRVPRVEFARFLAGEFRNKLGAPWVATLRTANVLFVLAPQEGHAEALAKGLCRVDGTWGTEANTVLHDAPTKKLDQSVLSSELRTRAPQAPARRMDDTSFIEAVAERDIDLLLLEELHCSADFRRWFAHRVFDNTEDSELVGAWHSVTHPRLGESDLILILEADQRRTAILIENKIDAVVQPDQAERYKQRGLEGIKEGRWDEFRTCMTAPQRYLDATADSSLYNAVIPYEAIRDWFKDSGEDPKRSRYKARMVSEAIEQNRRGYQPTPHEDVTAFWLRYWMLVQQDYPQLEMKKPGIKPADSDWPEFLNRKLGKGRRIVHKWRHECVDLEIRSAGERVDELKRTFASVLPEEADIVKTGGSASIRFQTNAVDRFGNFDAQVEAIRKGLDRAVELLKLSEIIGEVAPSPRPHTT